MDDYNHQTLQKRPNSSHSVFTDEEQPLLKPLPAVASEISQWLYGRRIRRNGQVVYDRNYSSAPVVHIGTKGTGHTLIQALSVECEPAGHSRG